MLNATNAELSKIDIVTKSGAEDILRRAKAIAVEEEAPEINLVSSGGQPANVLLESVKKYSVDLLVVGNKGMRSLAGRIFGNIPGNVAKKAPVDVMLVDTRAEGHD